MRQREQFASEVVREFDAQGIHRTGTDTDRLSGEWLAARARDAGAPAELQPFPLSRVDLLECFAELDGRRIDGLPLFDGAFTGADGVCGRLGLLASDPAIGLVDLRVNGAGHGDVSAARGSGAYAALIAVTRGASAGFAPSNAEQFPSESGCPVLQVGSEAGDWLAERAQHGTDARVVAHARRTDATAYNVVARLPGRDRSLPPVVVMTPRSGWWQCASERGGGLVGWLATIGAVVGGTPLRDVVFLASSGHELGHLGLEAFLAAEPELATGAVAWLHLGANIGAANGDMRLGASDDGLERLALHHFSAHNAGPIATMPRGWVPGGESRNIHVRGGRYLSLIGGNLLFHLQSDRWPSAIDTASIARFASACADVVMGIADDPHPTCY